MRRFLDGLLGAFGLLLVELAVVLLWRRREFASVWEVELGSAWLLPSALLIVLAASAVSLVLYELVLRTQRAPERVVLTLLTFGAGTALGYGVGGGRHLADPGVRLLFAMGLGTAAGALTYAFSPALRRAFQQAPGVSAGALAALLALTELVNRLVLPRLYPAFHWGLALFALTLAPWLGLLARASGERRSSVGGLRPPARPGKAASLGVSAVAVVAGLALVPSARRLAHFDNYRFVVLQHAPILGRAVELAARIAPAEPWDPVDCREGVAGVGCAEAAPASAKTRSLDLRGRDFLLITIDALRADHVGAYGYQRPTTPNIDRLAKEAALFTAAYTATPHTSYAVTSLMTGKHMRPLLLQGAGADSDTWATMLRTYGYRTAAFFPPAVFFIDTERFAPFQKNQLGFEYAKVEFAEGEHRVAQVRDYLAQEPPQLPLFMWVHLFSPHEPYVAHPEHPFGERDIDRYDSEIAEADATLGRVIDAFRQARPRGVVLVTADHGEEFGDHGGRYHGTSVYEEQLRVPLLIAAPGSVPSGHIAEVVQTIDLLPTVLGALDIPIPPRVRGRDLGALLARARAEEPGFAYGETDEQNLLARGSQRLICARRIGACQLFDLHEDPAETRDVTSARPGDAQKLRAELSQFTASHGRYETQGLRAEGKGWPAAILRGQSGDAEATSEVAALLDDVDPNIRRKAAQVLFELGRPESAPALRLAMGRDDDPGVRQFAALALTRMGEGAPLVVELLNASDLELRRLAALALGESGDKRGAAILIDWWRNPKQRDFTRSRQILNAFGVLALRDAVPFLTESLGDVRLRPYLARTLAKIGEESARVPLARAFADERSQSARVELVRALVALGGREEIAAPLTRFLGVADPLSDGLEVALKAHLLALVGGPGEKELPRIRSRTELGTRVRGVIPKAGNGRGIRALVRASCPKSDVPGTVVIGSAAHLVRYDRSGKPLPERGVPKLNEARSLRLAVPCEGRPREVFATVPESLGLRPGLSYEVIVFASRGVGLEALALVPLADELPPPPPKPWSPEAPGE